MFGESRVCAAGIVIFLFFLFLFFLQVCQVWVAVISFLLWS